MYVKIFNEVVNIMHHDYAGYLDKKGWDEPEKYKEYIKELDCNQELNDERFVEIVQDYLLDFKDTHMSFSKLNQKGEKSFDLGFNVRRFEDKLYVTAVGNERRLKPKDTIISLNNISIPKLVVKHQREFMETKAEREDWRRIIQKYTTAEVINTNGESQVLTLKRYEKSVYTPEHTIKKLNADTLLMTLTDFFNPDTINQLIEEHKQNLEETKNLIIDVRINYGGSDKSFQGLVNYLFPAEPTTLDFSDYAMTFNCTKHNAKLQTKILEEDLKRVEDKEIQKMGKNLIKKWQENIGKGFVKFDIQDSKVEVVGQTTPKNIIVLSDVFCGSAGDIFVYLCKMSPKITVIGRATQGMNDYSNLTTMKWNNRLKFSYPTSRLDQLDHRGTLGKPGIKPDIYIP